MRETETEAARDKGKVKEAGGVSKTGPGEPLRAETGTEPETEGELGTEVGAGAGSGEPFGAETRTGPVRNGEGETEVGAKSELQDVKTHFQHHSALYGNRSG